jgi:hypothetical protein
MLCYSFLNKRSLLVVLWFPTQTSPLAPCGLGSLQCMSQTLITKYGTIPTQPSTTHIICCPRVSTLKIQSLADSSMTNYITCQNLTVFTIPTLLKPQHRSSPRSNHISTDGRPSLTKTQADLNITEDRKTCKTLMTI